MKKTAAVAFVAVVLIAGFAGYYINFNNTSFGNLAAEPALDERQIEEPLRLMIQKLSVDAPIENVGLTEEKAMDVPKEKGGVGWYELGVKPGELGSAVLAGHLDDKEGDPEVFYNLKDLAAGDEITVEDEANKEYTFVVSRVEVFPQESFPLQEVFASYDKARLNLITCEGIYDNSLKLYTDRLVVFSELKN